MDKLAEQYIVDILISEMTLDTSHVWVSNQNRKIPNDLGVYIVVGLVDSQVFSSVDSCAAVDGGMEETQQVTEKQNIQIDILSRSNDALTRRSEIIAALSSVFSVQVQEANWFRIFPVSNSFVNSSSAEGGSQINRFSINVSCHVWYRKDKTLGNNYFDSFLTNVNDANTITLVSPTRTTTAGDTRITPSGDIRVIAGKTALIEFNIP